MTRATLVLGCLLAAAGCGGGLTAGEVGETPARETAPAIAGRTLAGDELALADLRGKPVFVVVWASW